MMHNLFPKSATAPIAMILLAAAFGLLVGAGTAKPARVAVFDATRITDGSERIQTMIAEASAGARVVREELEIKQREFKTASEKFASQKSVSSDDVNERRRSELTLQREAIEELQFRLNREINRAQTAAVNPMREMIMSTVRSLAAEQGLTVVLSSDNTYYFDPEVDLTADIIGRLDAR